jgi:hypothetical protein
MKELLRGESTISLEAAVLKGPNAEIYLYLYLYRTRKNCEETFHNEKHKQSNTHEKHKQVFSSENYIGLFHNR